MGDIQFRSSLLPKLNPFSEIINDSRTFVGFLSEKRARERRSNHKQSQQNSTYQITIGHGPLETHICVFCYGQGNMNESPRSEPRGWGELHISTTGFQIVPFYFTEHKEDYLRILGLSPDIFVNPAARLSRDVVSRAE